MQQTVFGTKLLQGSGDLELSSEGKKFVTDEVARYHLSRKRKTTSEQLAEYASVIVKVFRKEQKDTYFISKKGNPGGKLYSRINYIRQSDRKKLQAEDNRQTSTGILKNTYSTETLKAVSWLQLNHMPWASVLCYWEISFPAREELLQDQKKIAKLLKKYPHLGKEFGFQLIDIDYRLLGFGEQSGCQEKWEQLIDPISKYIAKYGRDVSTTVLLPVITNAELSLG
ncbi:uncharacterized protein LOC134209107 [Armigeres subalbatus]|uniref:uncharacterized protein LOC134209107 n=1 Tax=Armigeres subalbatus TaxID=124917 RepID=UPI002ED3D4DF